MWQGTKPYVPVRMMYKTMRPDGSPRPVIDLEPHYESTHYMFNVSDLLFAVPLAIRMLIYSEPIHFGQMPTSGSADGNPFSPGMLFQGAQGWLINSACGYTYGCNAIWQMFLLDERRQVLGSVSSRHGR
jgi:hypothetical protein